MSVQRKLLGRGLKTTNIAVSRLSKLQRWMLQRAQQNHKTKESERRVSYPGLPGLKGPVKQDLYYAEVLAGFYGFDYDHEKPLRASEHLGCQRFDPELIGRNRYNSTCAAVSRAVRSLDDRGLVTWMYGTNAHWAGFQLTEVGLAWARAMNNGTKKERTGNGKVYGR